MPRSFHWGPYWADQLVRAYMAGALPRKKVEPYGPTDLIIPVLQRYIADPATDPKWRADFVLMLLTIPD